MKQWWRTYSAWGTVTILIVTASCYEEIGFDTQNLENALIIETIISNENKKQEVLLSRSHGFSDTIMSATPERNAQVFVETDTETIPFEEVEDGVYTSVEPFAAQPNVNYTLRIQTNNGEVYSSTPRQLTTPSSLERLYAEREVGNNGQPVLSIFVDSNAPDNTTNYYRYQFEETYKIVAPKYSRFNLIITDPRWAFCDVELFDKEVNKEICYNTVRNTEVLQISTEGLNTNEVSRFKVRQIDSDNYIIGQRYSIEVKQYTQSSDAYFYFDRLLDFQEQPNTFSQVQPGYLTGNVQSSDSELLTIGFFDVSYVTSQRIFFNYVDFFPDVDIPSQVRFCDVYAPIHYDKYSFPPFEDCGPLILEDLPRDRYLFFEINLDQEFYDDPPFFFPLDGPYDLVPKECGDCTLFGSIEVPEFWVE
ncbi:DUF4249 domain-containing protein [Aureisphaera galaxeae]|uniref:DUF4249 domain-containing protein n=1 Tax=Aureisphaera galaxeae TaxID=1538023 RepID=UPI0023509C36|nr:DUF4249 domain-containing protein [Aureisphaera galaxeae]MDC8004751.1 DUF4249 domain-containing protein [Aureisphaera galaxeae]